MAEEQIILNKYGNTASSVAVDAMKDHNVIPAYRFQLKVNGVFDVPLKSVRPINRKYEYEPIQEGGLNDYVHIKRKPITQPYELVVERYLQTEIDDKLAVGSKMTLPLILYIGRANGQEMSMTDASRWYVFTGAQVLNVEFGGLDSEKSGLLTETVTIGYNMMFCLSSSSDLSSNEVPFDLRANTSTETVSLNTGELMEFRTLTNRKGKYAQDKGVIEISKKEMEARNRLWTLKDKEKEGAGKASRQNASKTKDGHVAGVGDIEETKEMLEGRRSLWQFALSSDGKSADVEGNGIRHVQNAVSTTDAEGNSQTAGIGRVQATKSEMEATALNHKFEFGKDASEILGNGVVSSQNYRETGKDEEGNPVYSGIGKAEVSKKDMETKRKRWEFDSTSKAGKGDASRMNRQKAVGTDSDSATAGVGNVEATKSEMEERANQHLFKFGTSKNEVKGNGVVSAKKDEKSTNDPSKATLWEFDQSATDTLNPPMEGNGKRHVQNASKGQDANGKDMINGIGRVETRKADMEGAAKLWKLTDQYTKDGNGVRSSMNARAEKGEDGSDTSTGLGPIEEKRSDLEGRSRLWSFDGVSKDGSGKRSRQNAAATTGEDGKSETSGLGTVEISKEAMEKGANLWNYSGDFRTEGAIAKRIEGELRKSEMEGKADKPEPILSPTPSQPKARKWKFNKTSKKGSGTASRASREDRAEASREEMQGKARKGYYVKPQAGTTPSPRLWPDQRSAISGGNENPVSEPARLWPGQESAAKRDKKGSTPAPRLWPNASSAEQPKGGQKPEVRKWPDTSSAAVREAKGEPAEHRTWPPTNSAAKNPNAGTSPRARLWPNVKSAQTIADFLMQ